jgi:eukaryotic-like serine/threonine-protein kinase
MQGTVLGTLQYMAPEQIEGQEADARTDLFAFGAVLYEMVTGRRAFEGKSQASLMASILEREPASILSLQPMAPAALDRVVRKCLTKSAESRWQTALDLMDELKWISQSGLLDADKVALSARPTRRGYLLQAVGAIVVLVLGLAIGIVSSRLARPDEQSIRLSIPVPDNAVFSWYSSLEISPDGTQVAFVAISGGKQLLWVRPLDSLQARALAGTEGATSPFWSPDSRYLGYFSGGMLYKIAVAQGVPQALSTGSAAYQGGAWGRDNVIVFTRFASGGLYRVSAIGGDAVPVTELDRSKQEVWHQRPHFLPDGTHFLYFVRSPVPQNNAVYVAAIDSNERKRVFVADSEARYAAPGYLLFGKRGVLMTQRFDVGRLELSGESFPVAEAVHYDPEPGTIDASVSATGVLTYRAGYKGARIVWVDRNGKEIGGLAAPGEYRNLALSPDEKSVLFDRYEPQVSGRDVWRYDFERATTSRLTFDPADDSDAHWAPDGQNIVFGATRNGVRSLVRKGANGDGQEETLFKTAEFQVLFPRQWSSDGRFITFDAWTRQSAEVQVMPLEGNRESYRLVQSNFPTRMARISHDGRWIAYESEESGTSEIYVQTFPNPGGKWQISTQGGQDPIWRRDDKELFYIAGDGHMMAVSLAGGAPFHAGVAKPLFTATSFPGWSVGGWGRYAVSADGQRFLIDVPAKDTFSPITVVLNWTVELAKKN